MKKKKKKATIRIEVDPPSWAKEKKPSIFLTTREELIELAQCALAWYFELPDIAMENAKIKTTVHLKSRCQALQNKSKARAYSILERKGLADAPRGVPKKSP